MISPLEILSLTQPYYSSRDPYCLKISNLPIPLDLIRIPLAQVDPYPPAMPEAPWMSELAASQNPLSMDEGHGSIVPKEPEPSKSKLLLLLKELKP